MKNFAHLLMEDAMRMIPRAHNLICDYLDQSSTIKSNVLLSHENWISIAEKSGIKSRAEHIAVIAGLSWMYTKAIYEIDPEVQKHIKSSTIPKDLPVEDIVDKFPEVCAYLDFGPIDESGHDGAFIAPLANEKGDKYFLISPANPGDGEKGGIGGFLLSKYNYQGLFAESTDLKKALINSVLFVVSQEHTSNHESEESASGGKKPTTIQPAKKVKRIKLGEHLREKLFGNRGGHDSAGHTSPHMRRGHWHHYWTGPKTGPRELKLNWVYPCFVSGRNGDDSV